MIFHYNTFIIERNEELFLDVNQKRPFLDRQKIPKATKLKKCPQKKISWVIWLFPKKTMLVKFFDVEKTLEMLRFSSSYQRYKKYAIKKKT